jgi:3-hydroxyacyl-CoA dehydrogenase
MTDIRRVAVISTGVIGASWAALFLAHGLDVTATDPAPGAETALRAAVAAAWPALTALGLAPGADPARLRFVATPEEAVAEAEFVQENGPEDLTLKQALFARLDAATPPGAVIASSSSSLLMTEVAGACPGAARILLGHPFNPPHLIPLVEVVGGTRTSEDAIARAIGFYRRLGKHPIRLKREIRGHVANRLQAALWQEAFHLLAEGVADLADIDAAIAQGPGLRWALLGPFLNLDLSGGPGGIGAFFGKPLWNATEALWAELGRVRVDPALAGRVVAGVAAELAGQDKAALVAARDAALIDLLRRKRDAGLR